MILTGRPVSGDEALRMGLANRIVPKGTALAAAVKLAKEIAAFPQRCMRADRMSSYTQWNLDVEAALREETRMLRLVQLAPKACRPAPDASAGRSRCLVLTTRAHIRVSSRSAASTSSVPTACTTTSDPRACSAAGTPRSPSRA